MKEQILTPKGFLFSVANAAIKNPDKPDIAIVMSEKPCMVSGLFTKNKVKAAPVLLDMERVKKGIATALVVNSGNANACTGKNGMDDAILMTDTLADALKVDRTTTFVASTGVIGERLPIEKIVPAIKTGVNSLGKFTPLDAAKSIMTTDTFPKILSTKTNSGTILGITKGAGMICPNMATTLTFLFSDVNISKPSLDKILKEATDKSFNSVTVDGDMSTNDTVLMFANGLTDGQLIDKNESALDEFKSALDSICIDLAKMLVKDGEGATKLFTVKIKNASNEGAAKTLASVVANSLLVKTAIYGQDANWGRIISALGAAGPEFDPYKTDIYFGPVMMAQNGLSLYADKEAEPILAQDELDIVIDLKMGSASAEVFTCDLTEEYIRINGTYRT